MKTDIEDEETVGLPGAVRSRISRLAKALKWKIYHLLFGFSAQASTLGVFKHASGLGSTNLQIFRFNFPTKRLWASFLFLLKNSEISTLLGSTRLFHLLVGKPRFSGTPNHLTFLPKIWPFFTKIISPMGYLYFILVYQYFKTISLFERNTREKWLL